ncbi:MAG: hypothetical protein JXB48_19530 [Candidatus Latescibacteria bacterium]|nr:hypothetical protein [Candidatus Latescibacterota bacterium]
MNYHFSSNKTKDIKYAKETLLKKGYPISDVIAFVKNNLSLEHYVDTLKGINNLYLVMPSTSGRNSIPMIMAAALQRSFGGEVIVDIARPMHETKSAYLSAIGKIREQRRYEIREEALRKIDIKNKNIVIVDDVVTTGVSVNSLRKSLTESGVEVGSVISIAQSDKRLCSERDLERVTEKLQASHPEDKELKDAVRKFFAGSLKHYLNSIEREITGEKRIKYREEFYEYIKREARRSRKEAQNARRVQPGDYRKTGLSGGGAQGGTGVSVREGPGTAYRSGKDGPVTENLSILMKTARELGYPLTPKIIANVSEVYEVGERTLQELRSGLKKRVRQIELNYLSK